MKRLISSVILTAFAGGALLSLILLGAVVHDNVAMPGCPLMPPQATVCTMSAIDHISAWQGMFTAVPQGMAFILLAAIAILAAWPRLARAIQRPKEVSFNVIREPGLALSPLQDLFSRGILNPKLY